MVVDVAGGLMVVATVLPEPPDVTEHADNVIPAAKNTDVRRRFMMTTSTTTREL
jgi:hypothetical protein